METPKIFESEYHFCLIMWEHEPVTTVELVKLCQEQLGWKRTTTYTVIKRLGERGVLKNEDGTITFETDHFSQYAVIGIAGDADLPIAAIIGIIAGALAVIAGGFCLYWFVFRKKRSA